MRAAPVDETPGIRQDADADPVLFWDRQARNLSWFAPWDRTLEWEPPYARWFAGGMINASYNALDIHQSVRSDKPAILWEGEDKATRVLTFGDVLVQVQKFANVLLSLGIKAGDRVAVYLPMVPELVVAMLACARIGAIHTVIFSGFSASSLRDRIVDSGSKLVVTADGSYRRGRMLHLKQTVDEAVSGLDFVEHVVVLERTGSKMNITPRDLLWDDLMAGAGHSCKAVPLASDHPLFILYTSGTTGRPKGVLHGTGGYLVHLHSTFQWAFDIRDSDVFFCTADIGWVTGHSYVVYAPFMHGVTQVMYEGAPDYPDASRMWKILQKYKATIFYTTPTLLRMLRAGDDSPGSFDLGSLRLLGTVGEPINPDVWRWYHDAVGGGRCPIIDTWWQTETGGMLVSPLPGIESAPPKPGSATRAIPGIDVDVVDRAGRGVGPNIRGHLVVRNPWPGMLLGLWNDDAKYRQAYWSKYEGCYYTGDFAMYDEDRYLWLLGRADDILKVAGHRIGTAELEDCIISCDFVAESAVCGIDDDLKGQAIIAFVVLRGAVTNARQEILSKIRGDIGAIATPKKICLVERLPKTRSGKIMRRLLKSVASGQEIGDTSTLEDGDVMAGIQAAFDAC